MPIGVGKLAQSINLNEPKKSEKSALKGEESFNTERRSLGYACQYISPKQSEQVVLLSML